MTPKRSLIKNRYINIGFKLRLRVREARPYLRVGNRHSDVRKRHSNVNKLGLGTGTRTLGTGTRTLGTGIGIRLGWLG